MPFQTVESSELAASQHSENMDTASAVDTLDSSVVEDLSVELDPLFVPHEPVTTSEEGPTEESIITKVQHHFLLDIYQTLTLTLNVIILFNFQRQGNFPANLYVTDMFSLLFTYFQSFLFP